MTVLKTRFAPSPTGRMHLGNARTALFSALLARRENGHFVLRIEDTDAARSTLLHAEGVLEDLAELFRAVLAADAEPGASVTLDEEIALARRYLEIEQVRFGERLRVEWAIDEPLLARPFPLLLLQPLVENAIRHGIGRRSAAGHLRIQAARVNGSLQIRVEDDGPGLAQDGPAAEPGIGLANTRSRLRQLYGDAARLTLENRPAGGAVATLVLPFRLEEDVRP